MTSGPGGSTPLLPIPTSSAAVTLGGSAPPPSSPNVTAGSKKQGGSPSPSSFPMLNSRPGGFVPLLFLPVSDSGPRGRPVSHRSSNRPRGLHPPPLLLPVRYDSDGGVPPFSSSSRRDTATSSPPPPLLSRLWWANTTTTAVAPGASPPVFLHLTSTSEHSGVPGWLIPLLHSTAWLVTPRGRAPSSSLPLIEKHQWQQQREGFPLIFLSA